MVGSEVDVVHLPGPTTADDVLLPDVVEHFRLGEAELGECRHPAVSDFMAREEQPRNVDAADEDDAGEHREENGEALVLASFASAFKTLKTPCTDIRKNLL
jgi:hypothetical protein